MGICLRKCLSCYSHIHGNVSKEVFIILFSHSWEWVLGSVYHVILTFMGMCLKKCLSCYSHIHGNLSEEVFIMLFSHSWECV